MIRLAIYFSPEPDSSLANEAALWLGRDAYSSTRLNHRPPLFISKERMMQITTSPKHYGFHATIKPPFSLKRGVDVDIVGAELERFCKKRDGFLLPPLQLSLVDGFFCLLPTQKCIRLHQLAEETVQNFDHFRADPSEKELTRRKSRGLTGYQEKMLRTWGYPYVMDAFRFHLTLTERVENEEEIPLIHRELDRRFQPRMLRNVPFSSLALFLEEDGRLMHCIKRFSL